MELFDAAGKKYEAVTEEEAQLKVQNAVKETESKLKTEFETKQKELENVATQSQRDLEKARQDLALADDKDKNYAELRKIATDAEKKAADAIAAKEDIVKKAVEGVQSTFAIRYRDGLIDRLANGDQALKDKLLVHYEKTLQNMPALTDSEVAKKVESAYRLSVDNVQPGLLNQVMGSKPTNSGAPASGADLAPELLNFGAQFGLSKDDIVKYTEKAKKNYINVIDNK